MLEELFPQYNDNQLLEGDTFEICTPSKKSPISFYSRLLAIEEKDNLPIYRVDLPREIGTGQNRQSYRVYVEREDDLYFEFRTMQDQPVACNIINLSPDGLKLDAEGDLSAEFTSMDVVEDCLIHLPNGHAVVCEIEIRHVYPVKTPAIHTLIGGILSIPEPGHRSKLDQFLAAVQRKQRRREARVV